MPPDALVSIIITSYNYGRFLRDAIDGALGQSHPHVEVIVVDDGSSDDSPRIIESYGGRIRAVLKGNEGPASSWNLGFSLSRGPAVIFLDSDDVLLPSAARTAVRLLDGPDVVRVQWTLWQIDEHGRRTGGLFPHGDLAEGSFRNALLKNGPASYVSSPTSGNAWARDFLNRVLPVPPQFKLMCDAYLMTTSPLHGTIRRVLEPQACYRTHGRNDYHAMSFLPRLRRDILSFDHRSDLLADYARRHGIEPDVQGWKASSWFYRLESAVKGIQAVVPEGATFVMVENGNWSIDRSIGRTPAPFLEKDGVYFGAPPDDETAVREWERMRREGATHIAFGWPAFWWLDVYPKFARHLRERYRCFTENSDLIVFG